MNYDFGNKRNWRRWQWNQIAARVKDKRNARVLFLAGEEAADIEVAEQKGFCRHNMIAIERDKDTAEKLRKRGLLVIERPIEDALEAWSFTQPVSVVVADLCCGLKDAFLDSIWRSVFNPSFRDCVYAVNMLRGRDAETNYARELIQQELQLPDKARHRGYILWHMVLMEICMLRAKLEFGEVDEQRYLSDSQYRSRVDGVFALFRQAYQSPAYNSYRSTAGSQVFDSAVFSNVAAKFIDFRNHLVDDYKGHDVRRHVAAVLAHQTMRRAA